MSSNVTPRTVSDWTVEQQHQRLKEVHKHLRYASTSDNPDEIRERLRREELALRRQSQEPDIRRN